MKNIALILSGAAAAMLVAVTGTEAQAQSWGGQRGWRQQHQAPQYQQYQAPQYQQHQAPQYYQHGNRWNGNGNINPYEAARLQQTQSHMQRMHYHAASDGYVDPYEAARLRQAQQMARRQAMHFRRNGY